MYKRTIEMNGAINSEFPCKIFRWVSEYKAAHGNGVGGVSTDSIPDMWIYLMKKHAREYIFSKQISENFLHGLVQLWDTNEASRLREFVINFKYPEGLDLDHVFVRSTRVAISEPRSRDSDKVPFVDEWGNFMLVYPTEYKSIVDTYTRINSEVSRMITGWGLYPTTKPETWEVELHAGVLQGQRDLKKTRNDVYFKVASSIYSRVKEKCSEGNFDGAYPRYINAAITKMEDDVIENLLSGEFTITIDGLHDSIINILLFDAKEVAMYNRIIYGSTFV